MQQSGGQKKRDWIDILVLVILALSLLAGLALRTYKMDWDRGHFYALPSRRASPRLFGHRQHLLSASRPT